MGENLIEYEEDLLATLMNTFGNKEEYATKYNIGHFIVKDMLRVIEIAHANSTCQQFKDDLMIVKKKIRAK